MKQEAATSKSKKDQKKVLFDDVVITNKKMEYLEEEILDKNGKFSYLENPQEYKKARK